MSDLPPPRPANAVLVEPDPIVKAAIQAVSAVFNSVATQLPDLVEAQAPSDSPIPAFTKTMIEQLQAQLNRALGLGGRAP